MSTSRLVLQPGARRRPAGRCFSSERLLGLALLCAVASACAGSQEQGPSATPALLQAGTPTSQPAVGRTLGAGEGERLYAGLCQSCHGAEGLAQTPLAQSLDPWPRDLTGCNFKYRSTPSGSLPRDEDLLRTLHVGIPGTAMPSLARLLSRPALAALLKQVKLRCARFGQEAPDPPLPPPDRTSYSAASVNRGQAIYRREGCAGCHGTSGQGDGPAAASLRDLAGRPLPPRDYTRGVFRSGFARRDIYRAFSTGLDGTPMPALTDAVPQADRWDLTHYLVSLSHERNRALRALEQEPSWYEPIRTWGLPWR